MFIRYDVFVRGRRVSTPDKQEAVEIYRKWKSEGVLPTFTVETWVPKPRSILYMCSTREYLKDEDIF